MEQGEVTSKETKCITLGLSRRGNITDRKGTRALLLSITCIGCSKALLIDVILWSHAIACKRCLSQYLNNQGKEPLQGVVV